MNKLKTITDFTIWLLFVSTVLLTIALAGFGSYELITQESWQGMRTLLGAVLLLAMHYVVRYLPVGKPRKQ